MARCKTTHHLGCDCHEARRDAELAEMKRQRDLLLEACKAAILRTGIRSSPEDDRASVLLRAAITECERAK